MSSVRLRRDFSQVLIAIKAHALLHHEHRRRRDDDSIVATIEEDYAEVYGLMADLVATASEQKIRKAMAETVAAVEKLAARLHDEDGVSVRAIANALKLDRSATYRRLSAAEDAGYVVNLAERRGQAGKYRTTGQEPSIGEVLPTVDALQEAREADQAARKDSRQYPGKCSHTCNRKAKPLISLAKSVANRFAQVLPLHINELSEMLHCCRGFRG